MLVQNGFLEGLRGKGGGYRLTRSPVSYTHLDVYKRQQIPLGFLLREPRGILRIKGGTNAHCDFIPVSYTHLDVYKRQESLTAEGQKRIFETENGTGL